MTVEALTGLRHLFHGHARRATALAHEEVLSDEYRHDYEVEAAVWRRAADIVDGVIAVDRAKENQRCP